MSSLLVRPLTPNSDGRVINVTPANAGWTYVGFDLYELEPGATLARETGTREVALVLIDGKARVVAGGREFGEIGERMDVFEHKKPWTVYAPNDSDWSVQATTRCTLAVCSAPGFGNHPVRLIKPDDVSFETRGKGSNTRHIHPILMEDSKWADSLLVTEVYTPSGNWSSYPPHRHDEDALPDISFLEETYYHRLNPGQGYAHHRVYTDIGDDGTRELDETMTVADGDVTLVPKGYHPCGAPYGYELYYLNVIAGPRRTWRFQNDPDHDWIFQRDKA